ncbi:hypothetical protein QYM36_002561 [Artemia franciscana]|uniref:Peroxisomal membrane protein 4 n=1 Tax=Artemia franciscana TaxID=6661 RepID=A0AA88LET0_ARTSF|nr:hypothetical protein QYM36_002561 [Artemia franciscana]
MEVLEFISHIIKEPGPYQPILAVIKGFRNGAVYGAKIRAPHALVMTFLFKTGSLRSKIWSILEATIQHSRNLAFFVTIYKTITKLLHFLAGEKEKRHSFVAAFIGGYLVFGENNRINQQNN